jgi:hypothetical protein
MIEYTADETIRNKGNLNFKRGEKVNIGGFRYDGKNFHWDPKKITFSREEINETWRKVMEKFNQVGKDTEKKQPKQPLYCHWRDGVWDGKFRDESGNIMGDEGDEQKFNKQPKQPFYCHWINGEWDRKFRDKDGNIVE